MLLLTGIGLILCMIAFIVLVIIFIINDIKEHKVKVGNMKIDKQIEQMDARTKAIDIITSERVQALEDAGLMIVEKDEIDRLKKKIDVVLQDFHQYVRGGKEICAFCLHDNECEPGETLCGATYKGFKSRWLNEEDEYGRKIHY